MGNSAEQEIQKGVARTYGELEELISCITGECDIEFNGMLIKGRLCDSSAFNLGPGAMEEGDGPPFARQFIVDLITQGNSFAIKLGNEFPLIDLSIEDKKDSICC